MHESMMTPDEIAELRRQVVAFFRARGHERVPLTEATAHFEALGHTITRPIEHTLQAHGVVERPEGPYRWPHPMEERPWRASGGALVPA